MAAPTSDCLPEATPGSLPPWLHACHGAVSFLVRAAFALSTLLVLVDLILLGISVLARYVLNAPITWSDEIVALSLAAITMLAAPRVLLERGHIEVDILTAQARGRLALMIRFWSSAAVIAVALLLVFNGWKTAMFSRMIRLLTEGYLELPLWMLQLLLPLGGALLLPVALLQIAETAVVWRRLGNEPEVQA